jgi:two-component system, LytTR family, response regulator
MSPESIRPPEQDSMFPRWIALGAVGLAAAYVIVFLATRDQSLGEALVSAVANVAPLALLALGVKAGVTRVQGLQGWWAVGAWAAGATLFAVCWYLLIAVFYGLEAALRGDGLKLRFLTGPALIWQAFQGGLVVVLIAVTAHFLDARARLLAELAAAQDALNERAVVASSGSAPMLVKFADELQALDTTEILTIEAADDHTVIVLPTRRVRSANRMQDWERQLDPSRFLRAHRSHIINLDRLISVEPSGGGRMIAHLESGHSVPVSRAGALALKARSL